MPSFARSMLLAAPSLLLAVISTAPITSAYAVASPIPTPMPLQAADYSAHSMLNVPSAKTTVARSAHKGNHSSTKHLSSGHFTSAHGMRLKTHSKVSRTRRPFRRDDDERMAAMLSQLRSHRDSMNASARRMRGLADQSSSPGGFSSAYQQDTATEATKCVSSAQSFNAELEKLGADKGLAFYDRDNKLEEILKAAVNAHKDFLTSVDLIVYNVPMLGPILGPIVYDLKCLIDDILNITENATDAMLNGLKPLLGDLLWHSKETTCALVKILGLCI